MLMKSHSTLCFPSLPRQESRQVLHSDALADSGSLVWNCISTALLCFDLLLLVYFFFCREPVLGSLLPGTSSLQKYPPRASFGTAPLQPAINKLTQEIVSDLLKSAAAMAESAWVTEVQGSQQCHRICQQRLRGHLLGLPIEDVLIGEVDWFRLASLIRWVDGRSGRWRSSGCLGREELGSSGKLKAKEFDKGGTEYLCFFNKPQLPCLNPLELVAELHDMGWWCCFYGGSRWWELAAGGLGGVGGVGAKLAPAYGVHVGQLVELATAVGAWGSA
ncbi:hypothetical protein V6N13_024800 [Hibiscus sabdariffa]|uniref:Uncharacterized protein n=1 Tax=Hibiscus sabdariffa TaxID=183260 RepID=A0ABR2QGL2_9ROSI